jgi:asparagine synthase (glutamine-hydrolysing)
MVGGRIEIATCRRALSPAHGRPSVFNTDFDMCGIAGVFDWRDHSQIDRDLLARATRVLAHRGPDGEGFFYGPGIGLGHRRLAIIDVAGGDQPIFNEDGTVCVVFNGEIYNFPPLMAELSGLGHRFRTRSDTEVIVHAWEEWGEACLDHFNGQFAFALWDARTETLFLARDRLGEKPLYYSFLADGRLLFASELKSLSLFPEIDRRLDPQAIEEFFAFGYVPDPHSIYRGVRKLPPAHYLLMRRGEPPQQPLAYWDVRFLDDVAVRPGEVAEELILRLREAVRLRMIADVPLGAFLSGGADSSGVVAMMARLQPEPVRTFSIAFGARGWDESAYAAAIAERYCTDHQVREVKPDSFDLVDRLVDIYDEPFGDASAMPTFRVSAMAREHVTVALSGDGGDEVFAGYRRYRWQCIEERVRRSLPPGIRRPVFGVLGRLYPKFDQLPRPLRAKATFQELARDPVDAYFSSVSVCGDALRQRLFSPALRRELAGYSAVEVLRRHMAGSGSEHALSQVQYADLKTYLPGDILTKVDRASMANSLEVRVPLLDHTLVEWAARLPPALKLSGRDGKYVLKKALEPYLPRDILYRPKQGFAVPLVAWFRGPLRQRLDDTLLGPTLRETGLFDMRFVERLVNRHQSGAFDHSAPLWILTMFEAFLRASYEERTRACRAAATAQPGYAEPGAMPRAVNGEPDPAWARQR